MAADHPPPPKVELSDSGLTMPSDSENYSANHEMVSSTPSTSSAPLVLYKPPSFWGMLRGAAINLVLPFVNGLMLGFGELFAHETAFRLGWSNTKVCVLFLAYGILCSWMVAFANGCVLATDLPYLPAVTTCQSWSRNARTSAGAEGEQECWLAGCAVFGVNWQ